MDIHLLDGTYELFRHFYAVPPAKDANGREIGAVRGVLLSVAGLLDGGATHIGVATDHVIESFRNELYPGYKTSAGMDPVLLAQFPVLEEALECMGIKVWPMVEYEADDALAAAAAKAARDARVRQVIVCTPDKDLAQSVSGTRVVQFDRMRRVIRDEDGVVAKFGVRPVSIPDYLAVVGDSADGFPGLPGWGPKAASALLSEYTHLENIPQDYRQWPRAVRGAQRLSAVLADQWKDALLFRTLATLQTGVPVFDDIEELRWRGPTASFETYCRRLQAPDLQARISAAGSGRAAHPYAAPDRAPESH